MTTAAVLLLALLVPQAASALAGAPPAPADPAPVPPSAPQATSAAPPASSPATSPAPATPALPSPPAPPALITARREETVESQFVLAKLLAAEGSVGEALAAYEAAEKLAAGLPKNAAEDRDLAYLHIEHAQLLARMAQRDRRPSEQEQRLRQAKEQVDLARRLAPNNLDALRAVGSIYVDLSALESAVPGALETARDALEAVHKAAPDDTQTALLLGRIYLEQSQPGRAAEVFRELIRQEPQQRIAYALLVEALLRSDRSREAEGVLADILKLDAGAVEARLTLAELQSQREDRKAALATLEAAPEPSRSDPRLLRQLAWSYYFAGDPDKALKLVRPLLATDREDPQLTTLEGLIFSSQGRNAEAIDLLSKVHASRPDNPTLALSLSRVLEREGRHDEAAQILTELVAALEKAGKAPEARQARLELAQIYLGAPILSNPNKVDKVKEAVAPVLAQTKPDDPLRVAALLLEVDALLDGKRFDEALALLGRGEKLDKAPALRGKRAEVLLRAGREGEARHELDELGRSDEQAAVLGAAEAYQRVEKYTDSIPLLERFLSRRSDSVPAAFLLATAYERSGNRDRAVSEFRRVLGLNPDYHLALNYLGYMFAERGENLEEARQLVEHAVALEPENGAYVDSLGWVYFQLGRYEEARVTLERAAHLETGDATLQEHLGDVYHALGQVKLAEAAYRRAIELDGAASGAASGSGTPGVHPPAAPPAAGGGQAPAPNSAKIEELRRKLHSLEEGAHPN